MKTNAPEKIWINPTTDLPKLSGVMDKNSIEYIHKDAFIEKSVNFLEMLGNGAINESNWCSEKYNTISEFIEGLRKEFE